MPVDLRHSILKVLAYFDLFDYPVSKEEILSFLDQRICIDRLSAALQLLMEEKRIFLRSGFYMFRDNEAPVIRRITGNRRAKRLIHTGNRISRFLYQFPYVRGIGISGSLSKGFAAEDADIDYFIITGANRLWVARTILHLFKKFSFLLGRQHWYCMNYFVDEEALEIEEKNIFTAIELVTLLPVCGNGVLHEFFIKNNWAASYYPNHLLRIFQTDTFASDSKGKRMLESLFNNRIGDWLDNYCMRLTSRRWKKKEDRQKRSEGGRRMSLYTGKHISKPNPGFFQNNILTAYQNRLKDVISK